MRRLLALLPWLAGVALAAAEPAIYIDRPLGTDFVSGRVRIELAVVADEPVREIRVYVDGSLIAKLVEPPWILEHDVGGRNMAHEFKAILETEGGKTAGTSITTPAMKVDDEMDVGLQQLYVTVSQGDSRRLDLDRGDFDIFDNGERQEIVTFERGDVPLTSVVMLDCSLSMQRGRLERALAGAQVFMAGLRELDRTMVMLFSDRLLEATEFSSTPSELATTFASVEAAGGTAINDHLFLALENLQREQGRRVVVLFTDGADVHSVLEMADVLEKVRRSPALLYWIYLGDRDSDAAPEYTSSWRGVKGNQQEFRTLQRAVRESGGRIQRVAHVDQLEDAFRAILEELRSQYVLGYYPSSRRRDGSWHDVRVRVAAPGLAVRTRDGYVDW